MDQARIFAGEEIRSGAGFPGLSYLRPGDAEHPLIVFLPGGGHLARVAYGHPGAYKPDFVDHWLGERGYGLLALSYPCDHPVFDQQYPEMTITDWGRSTAAITHQMICDHRLSKRVVLVGWSLGGRPARNFTVAASELGIDVESFISIAAAPPLPGSGFRDPSTITFTDGGLWSVMESGSIWETERREAIDAQNRINNREIASFELYRRHYCANTPVQLRGEEHRIKQGRHFNSQGDAAEDQGSFRFADYPIAGAIVPTQPSDARHALTDALTWAFLNSQKLYYGVIKPRVETEPPLSTAAWQNLRALMAQLPTRLCRTIEAGHYGFIGEIGARETVDHIDSLINEIRSLKAEVAALLV